MSGVKARGALYYEYFVLYAGFLLFALPCLLWSLLSRVFYWVLPRRISAPLGRLVLMTIFRVFIGGLKASGLIRCDLSALDALRDERSLIIAPNHPSLLDAVFVVSRLPHVVCIMKADLCNNVVLGGGACFAGYIRDNGAHGMIRSAVNAVRAGNQLLIFPEGTRTRQPPVNHFKGGFALIAKRTRVPVQTIFIESNSPFLGKAWPLFRKPVFPLVFSARLGRRFSVDGEAADFAAGIEHYFRRTMVAANACRNSPIG